MKKNSIVIIGSGGHARSCIDVIEYQAIYSVAGFLSHPSDLVSEIFGYKCLGSDEVLPQLVRQYKKIVLGIGQIKNPDTRVNLFQKLKQIGYDLPIIVSPAAYVSERAIIGEGTIIMHGAIINAGAVVGKNCIINTNALIEHDASVGDHTHISTGAIINGGVNIGPKTFIGSRAVIKNQIEVGANCIVGMGATLGRGLDDDGIFYAGG